MPTAGAVVREGRTGGRNRVPGLLSRRPPPQPWEAVSSSLLRSAQVLFVSRGHRPHVASAETWLGTYGVILKRPSVEAELPAVMITLLVSARCARGTGLSRYMQEQADFSEQP